MTDITVRIMFEVLSILGILTKEIGQGQMSTSFPVNTSIIIELPVEKKDLVKLVGREDVMGAFQRMDKLTQEVARMAAAEALKVARSIDENVKDVGEKGEGVGDKIQGVDRKIDSVIQGELCLH